MTKKQILKVTSTQITPAAAADVRPVRSLRPMRSLSTVKSLRSNVNKAVVRPLEARAEGLN